MSQSFFYKAQGVSIASGTFNSVLGDQHNHYNQIIQQADRKLTEFDDFRNLKRGDICKLLDICQTRHCFGCRRWSWEECRCLFEATKTICTAKITGVEGEFTAVSYSGPDAHEAFKEEFLKLSRILSAKASQVYAIANGTIPSMVLWHNLIPLAQFVGSVGRLGLEYLEGLRCQWNCRDEELWMDSSKGVICRGPKGPHLSIPPHRLDIKNLPPTAELLQEEVLLRFLASCEPKKADDEFEYAMWHASNDENVPERVNRPTIFSTLTKTPIAVADNAWKSKEDNLVDRTCLENGWTRFRLNGDGRLSLEFNGYIKYAWLPQAWSVFHARGVSLNSDLEDFRLVFRRAWLKGDLAKTLSKCQMRQHQPTYLFVYPCHPDLLDGNTSSLHHWSFQEDGHSQLSPELRYDLSLPAELQFHYSDSSNAGFHSYSWFTDSYKWTRQYQVLRGFDPTTADFARHLGYDDYIFHSLNNSDRFDEVHQGVLQTSEPFNCSLVGQIAVDFNSEDLSEDTHDRIRAVDTVSVDDCTTTSDHDVPNKRRKTDLGVDGIEARNHSHRDLHHKNSPTHQAHSTMDTGFAARVTPSN
ncbi:hypothetical protein PQX77_019284 [Marasmius sp. AFHP31]|nr:hypothetical protein PQX77_019284 [Marasmius sp. AFHP31]